MATLTAWGTAGPVELRFEVDPKSSRDVLVLRGRGVLDRPSFGTAKRAWSFGPRIQLELAVCATRAETPIRPHRAVLPEEGPIHSVAVPTNPQRSDLGVTGAFTPPIGRYRRVPVQIHQADPDAPEVARRLIALIATRWPGTPAEHVGSTAVPGLAGKNTIDLLLAAPPAYIPAITQALVELGFQPQVPAAFPPTRPMLWGTYRHRGTDYPVHVHVVPADSPEVATMRGLRDALRADPVLRRRYAALKRAIVAGGPADPVAFTKAKHDWIVAALTRLGLASHPPRRLYQHDPDHDRSHRLASWPTHPLAARACFISPCSTARRPGTGLIWRYARKREGDLMDIAVIGTGKIGRTLGEALAAAGHDVRYGSRTPEESVREALDGAETVIVGIPGQSVADFARDHADELAGKVVIDASNKFGDGPAHSAAEFAVLAPAARYARAFNALGWENFADPVFDGVVADLFYSADEANRETVERLIRDTGLNPVYLGPDQHDLLDQLLKLWFTLANGQGRGRHLAFKVL